MCVGILDRSTCLVVAMRSQVSPSVLVLSFVFPVLTLFVESHLLKVVVFAVLIAVLSCVRFFFCVALQAVKSYLELCKSLRENVMP